MKKFISYAAIALLGLIASPLAILFVLFLICVGAAAILMLGGLLTAVVASLVPLIVLGGVVLGLMVIGDFVIERLRE